MPTKWRRKDLHWQKSLLASNEKEKFLDEISKAMWGFISDKLQIPVSDLSKESATEALLKINIKPELVTEFTDTIDKCEFPASPDRKGKVIGIYTNGIKLHFYNRRICQIMKRYFNFLFLLLFSTGMLFRVLLHTGIRYLSSGKYCIPTKGIFKSN